MREPGLLGMIDTHRMMACKADCGHETGLVGVRAPCKGIFARNPDATS